MRYHYLLPLFAVAAVFCAQSENTISKAPIKSPSSFFLNEVRPEANKPCFEGAYYRKVVSSKDFWGGIGGKLVLPQISFDPSRVNPAKPAQYLDNPSIYLGGNMDGQETDIGLAWEVIRDEKGNVSSDKRAFRPFFRRTGHVASGQVAVYENAPAQAKYYWYSGEEVYMSLKIIANGVLRFTIEGAGKKFEKDFECKGYSFSGVGEFKRVNAIDQVGNEGKPVQATQTKVTGAVWKSTSLYRIVNGELKQTPFHNGRYTDMRCPMTSYFSISANKKQLASGAESIDISGGGY